MWENAEEIPWYYNPSFVSPSLAAMLFVTVSSRVWLIYTVMLLLYKGYSLHRTTPRYIMYSDLFQDLFITFGKIVLLFLYNTYSFQPFSSEAS